MKSMTKGCKPKQKEKTTAVSLSLDEVADGNYVAMLLYTFKANKYVCMGTQFMLLPMTKQEKEYLCFGHVFSCIVWYYPSAECTAGEVISSGGTCWEMRCEC